MANIALCLLSSQAIAFDAGRVGPVYEIREPDFLDEITRAVEAKVESGEWKKLQEDAKQRARVNLANPRPVDGLVTATARHSWLFDPSVTISQDIRDAAGNRVFPAGTRINPLDYVTLSQPLVFFDGRDAKQVKAARALMKKFDGAVTPILVAGSWQKLGSAWQRQVYYDHEGRLVRQLGIQAVPAIVTQEARVLRVEEFKP